MRGSAYHMVNGQALYTVNVLADTMAAKVRGKSKLKFLMKAARKM